MRHKSLIPIISGADLLDEEDVFIRCALVVALRGLDPTELAKLEGDDEDRTIEDRGDATVNGGRYGGALEPGQLPHHPTARAHLHYSWVVAASLVAVVMFGNGVAWGGTAPSECQPALNCAF